MQLAGAGLPGEEEKEEEGLSLQGSGGKKLKGQKDLRGEETDENSVTRSFSLLLSCGLKK